MITRTDDKPVMQYAVANIHKAAALATIAARVLLGTTGLQRAYADTIYSQGVLNNFTRTNFGVTVSELISSLRDTGKCPSLPGHPQFVRGVRLDRVAKGDICRHPRVSQLNGDSAALMSDGSLLVDVLFDGSDRRQYILIEDVKGAADLPNGLLSHAMHTRAQEVGLFTLCRIIESAVVAVKQPSSTEKALFV